MGQPRCREWYRDTLQYTFEGTIDQAFPNGTFDEWMSDSDSAKSQITNCKNNKKIFKEMWNNGKVHRYNGSSDYRVGQVVWKRYLFNNGNVGVTGSRTITDMVTGELLAIVGVDYTLDWLSETLADRTMDTKGHIDLHSSKWKTWIFEKSIMNHDNDQSGTGHVVVSSSDGNLLKNASSMEGCYGFQMTQDNLQMPQDADTYPDEDGMNLISIYSREIIEVHGFDGLPVNESDSEKVRVPYPMPHLEAGRIEYYPGCPSDGECASIDWILMVTMDWDDAAVDDLFISLTLMVLLIIAILLILRTYDISEEDLDISDFTQGPGTKKKGSFRLRSLRNKLKGKREKSKTPKEDFIRIDHECDDSLIGCQGCDTERYYNLMKKMHPLVTRAAKAIWARNLRENVPADSASILTTEAAKNFLANRANKHINASNENNKVFRKCAWFVCMFILLGRYSILCCLGCVGTLVITLQRGRPFNTNFGVGLNQNGTISPFKWCISGICFLHFGNRAHRRCLRKTD